MTQTTNTNKSSRTRNVKCRTQSCQRQEPREREKETDEDSNIKNRDATTGRDNYEPQILIAREVTSTVEARQREKKKH